MHCPFATLKAKCSTRVFPLTGPKTFRASHCPNRLKWLQTFLQMIERPLSFSFVLESRVDVAIIVMAFVLSEERDEKDGLNEAE
jgi:hypothetical protein